MKDNDLMDEREMHHVSRRSLLKRAGAAGLSAALAAAAKGHNVLLLSKGVFGSGSTPWAQGGLAATLAPDDTAELHAADTRTAGAGLCDDTAVRELTTSAPAEIATLRQLGYDDDIKAAAQVDRFALVPELRRDPLRVEVGAVGIVNSHWLK